MKKRQHAAAKLKPFALFVTLWTCVMVSPCAAQRVTASSRAPARAIWRVSFTLDFAEGSPYRDYFPDLETPDYPRAERITKIALGNIILTACREAHVSRRGLFYGPSGLLSNYVMPSAQLDILATKEEAVNTARIIGFLAQQSVVTVSRAAQAGVGNCYTLRIVLPSEPLPLSKPRSRPASIAPRKLADYFAAVRAIDPDLSGFEPIEERGHTGLAIVDINGNWPRAACARHLQSVRQAARTLGIGVHAKLVRLDYVEVGNRWKTHPDGDEYLAGLTGPNRANLASRLAQAIAARAKNDWIAPAFANAPPLTEEVNRPAPKQRAYNPKWSARP